MYSGEICQYAGGVFIKHLKGNSGNQIQKLAHRQVTRTKVAHAVVNAKKIEVEEAMFVSNDMPECQALWETAADNVFELVDMGNKINELSSRISFSHQTCYLLLHYCLLERVLGH